MVAVESPENDALGELDDQEQRAVSGTSPFDWRHYNPNDFDDSTQGGKAGKRSDNEALLAQHLRGREEGAGALGSGDTTSAASQPAGAPSLAKRINGILWGNRKRKAGTIGSGIGITGLVGILTLLGFSSGPLEFIHIAQILTHAHFGHISAASDVRLGKMMYKAMASKSLNELDFGDTRLGIFFNTPAQKNAILKDLASKGIEPDLGTLKTFKGFTLDTTNPNSKYYGMSQEDALKAAKEDLGGKVKLSDGTRPGTTDVWDGKIYVESSFLNESSAIRGMVGLEGKSGLATFLRARTLIRYTQASNFHPFRKLDAKINEKVVDAATALKEWAAERVQELKSGVNSSTADTTKAEEETTDAHGNKVDTPLEGGEAGPVSSEKVTSTLEGIKTGAGAAGAIATVVAIVCILQAVDKNIGIIRFMQVILPLTRMGTDILSMGSQAQAGGNTSDILKEMGYMQQHVLVSYDSKTHQPTSSWFDAATMQADMGQSGGIDVNPAMKDAFSNDIPWLAWTRNGVVDTVCSTAGQIVGGAVSVVVGVISGGVVSTLIGLAAGIAVLPKVVAFVSGLIAGSAVNVNASGAEWGNDVNYGARLAANSEALQFGGSVQSNQSVAELNAQQQADDKKQLESMSVADRLFNVNDYRSLAGSAIDQLNLSGGPQEVVARVGAIPAAFISSIFSLPMNILTPKAHAATTTYQYPFPEYGFSLEDQNSPLVQDPATNAKAVGDILDGSEGQQYIDKALDCFGIAIAKDNGLWNAVPSTNTPKSGQDRTYGVDPYEKAYDSGSCADSSDQNWLRIRFWIFDTGVMEGYACYLGDATSCTNSGF